MTLRHLTTSLIATAAVAAPIAGCGDSDASGSAQGATTTSSQSGRSAGAAAVTISDFEFTPGALTVRQGARITVTITTQPRTPPRPTTATASTPGTSTLGPRRHSPRPRSGLTATTAAFTRSCTARSPSGESRNDLIPREPDMPEDRRVPCTSQSARHRLAGRRPRPYLERRPGGGPPALAATLPSVSDPHEAVELGLPDPSITQAEE